jgi:hypothetical protein
VAWAVGLADHAWVPAGALVVLFALLAIASWRRWADPIVDFGNEPYLSWQMLAGRRLYDDLASLPGPLSPWLNALWFAVGGASLQTLALCNLALAGGLAILIYRLWAACENRLTATVVTAVLLVSFVFAHHTEDAANYNFVWPYTHAATHGILLLLGGVVALSHAVRRDDPVNWWIGGLLLGATALTKSEIAVSAAFTAMVAAAWRATDGRAGCHRGLLAFAAGALVPLGSCAVVLGRTALLAPWAAAATVAGGRHDFFSHLMGTDDLVGNARRLAIDATVWTLVAGGLVWADLRSAAAPSDRRRWFVIAGMAVVGMLLVRDLPAVGRPLPVLVPLAGGALAWIARRRPNRRDDLAPCVLWAAAAWPLLGRMLLNVHFHHYGFYLAMPSALLVVVLGVGAVPRLLAERARGAGGLVRAVSLASIGLLVVYSGGLSAAAYGQMTVPVGRGADALLGPAPSASPTGILAATIEARIDARVPRDATLAVVPQGTLLNFLTRRPNPTPYHDLMPPIFAIYGTQRILAAYDARPPEYVVLVAWSGEEYGVGTFGSPDWGRELVDWVSRHYEQIESVPSTPTSIGFSMWRRRTAEYAMRSGGSGRARPSGGRAGHDAHPHRSGRRPAGRAQLVGRGAVDRPRGGDDDHRAGGSRLPPASERS